MALRRFRAVPASEHRYGLAEGPVWDAPRQRVLWVDIYAGAVHSGAFDGAQVSDEIVLQLPETVGAVLCSAAGELLVAGARRLYDVSVEGVVRNGPEIIAEGRESRLNDADTDPAGRCLVGSLVIDDRSGEEVLVAVDADGRITVIDDDLSLSNGLAFTPDGAYLYSIDTTPGIVWIRDYRVRDGGVGPRREFLRMTDGSPDGMCVDSLGNVWIAIWGGGEVRCYSPSAELLAIVETGAPNTSSVAFVGPNLETLLITSARLPLSEEVLAEHPDSGRLFIADVEVTGLEVAPWTGTKRFADTR